MKNMNYPRGAELHRRAGRQAARQDWTVGCTLNWAVEKGGPEGCAFLQPAAPPFCAARRPAFLSSVQPAYSSRFSFGNTALQLARAAGPPISVIRSVVLKCLALCLITIIAARFLHLYACLTCSSVHTSSLHPLLAHHHLCYVDVFFSLYFFLIL